MFKRLRFLEVSTRFQTHLHGSPEGHGGYVVPCYKPISRSGSPITQRCKSPCGALWFSHIVCRRLASYAGSSRFDTAHSSFRACKPVLALGKRLPYISGVNTIRGPNTDLRGRRFWRVASALRR